MHSSTARSNAAFTLIEIAVVLVIIGLLVGGIIIGMDVIRNSQIQSVISDIGSFQSSMKQFRDKYKYLPGDFPNATAIWGAQGGCSINTGGTSNTCNGNGDGRISGVTAPTTAFILSNENYYAWKHLLNAGFLVASYDGYGYGRVASKLRSNFYSVFYSPAIGTLSGVFTSKYGNILVYGDKYISSSYPSYGAGLTGAEASYIDLKMDDGRPGLGQVLSYTTASGSPTTSCATSSTQLSATYNVSSGSTLNCALIFLTGF